jgi:hypothetical protein
MFWRAGREKGLLVWSGTRRVMRKAWAHGGEMGGADMWRMDGS